MLSPHLWIDGLTYRVLMLEMASIPLTLIGTTVASARFESDAITNALDAVFRGYPVGLAAR